MKERLITLLCALGALLLFFTMFVRGRAVTGDEEVPRPTTVERRGNGYFAAMEWLDASHIRSISLRDRFDKLATRKDLAPRGNILIVTLPATAPYKTEEFRPLDHWVRAGNTMLVLAALSDSPDWAFSIGSLASGDLNLLTGLNFETVKTRERRLRSSGHHAPTESAARPAEAGTLRDRIAVATRRLTEPTRETFVANRPHAYFAGVRAGVALSDYASQPWSAQVPYDGFVFELAHEHDSGEGVLWTRPLGNGRIVVSAFGSLFTNRTIGLADNARLLANIVSANLGPRGAVLFDDAHQGLGSGYDPVKFYHDRRLRLTLGIVAALWLCWVLGATRLRLPAVRVPVPREAELVRSTGGFLARVLMPAAAARRMIDRLLQRAPWPTLERHPRIAPGDIQQLKTWYTDAYGAGQVPLVRVHNLISKINRQLDS
ncbi:MAG TPA: DUF4350 domain-containing protein [Steroidobacteraceae bacterium]|nr:DUF4350 domain-containing protein [Steroidobacteraceae bacterium]